MVYVTMAGGCARRISMLSPKVVHISSYLQCSAVAGRSTSLFAACRIGLLAYVAFPNKHYAFVCALSIMNLGDEDARRLFEYIVRAGESTRRRWDWNAAPPFLVRAWITAKEKDARAANNTANTNVERKHKREAQLAFEDSKVHQSDQNQERSSPQACAGIRDAKSPF